MIPFDLATINARFFAKIDQIKKSSGEPTATISQRLSGSPDRIRNIKRGLATLDLEVLHNLEQIYGVDQYEIIKGVSIEAERQKLEETASQALGKMQEIVQLLNR